MSSRLRRRARPGGIAGVRAHFARLTRAHTSSAVQKLAMCCLYISHSLRCFTGNRANLVMSLRKIGSTARQSVALARQRESAAQKTSHWRRWRTRWQLAV